MDINGYSHFRLRQTPSTDRFLGAFPSSSQSPSSEDNNELHEDDIFSTGDFSQASNHQHHRTSPPSSTSYPRHLLHHKTPFHQSECFGILAALPEHKINLHNHLYQKTAISSPPSSSRFIPCIPKPPQERLPSTSCSSGKFQQTQSAPVNVPVMEMAMRSRRQKEFDEIDEDENEEEEEGDGEMLPPHEIVARSQTPMVACSVLEGVGRTLKGRDLRQVRNAVWRQTGFLD